MSDMVAPLRDDHEFLPEDGRLRIGADIEIPRCVDDDCGEKRAGEQEARQSAEKLSRQLEIGSKKRKLERKRAALEAQIAALRAEFEAEDAEAGQVLAQENELIKQLEMDAIAMGKSRKADRFLVPRNGNHKD